MTQTKFQNDKTKNGWELLENVRDVKILPIDKLEPFCFLKKGEVQISERTLSMRANKNKANLGQIQAEHLVKHQEDIPKKWHEFNLIFPGTVWRVYNSHCIPYLKWWDRKWILRFCLLGGYSIVFESYTRMLCPCS